jgi:ABC-2 type transport system permease protein
VSAGRSFSVASGVAVRGARKLIGHPVGAVSQMAIPLFFFTAFTGALSAVGSTHGFGYYNFTAFVFVFVLFEGAVFAGVFAAVEIAADYGSGMGDRLMLSAPRRTAIIVGYLTLGLARAAFWLVVAWGIALAIGMPVQGDALDITGLIALALLLNLATTLWGAGIALRFKTVESGVLIMIPTFMLMFLSPVFVPRDRLSGWLKDAAGANPFTPPLEAGRSLIAGDPARVGRGFAAVGGLVIFFSIWAVRGMRKAEKGPGAGAPRQRGRQGGGRQGGTKTAGKSPRAGRRSQLHQRRRAARSQ